MPKKESLNKALWNTYMLPRLQSENCVGRWKHNDERERHSPYSYGDQSLLGDTEIKLFFKVGKGSMRKNYTMDVSTGNLTFSFIKFSM